MVTRAPALCILDECGLHGQKCTSVGQTCHDPNTDATSTGDWVCQCQHSGIGSARARPAFCAYTGECAQNSLVCTSVGQSCHDPNILTPDDWQCVCVLPRSGSATRTAAVCSAAGE
eukprot:gene649-7142_t